MKKHVWLLLAVASLMVAASFGATALGSTTSQSNDWPMFHQDPSRNGYAGENGSANSAVLLWNFTTGRMVQSSPAVVYGLLFVGSRDSQVYCINASSGGLIWKYPVRYEVWSSPTVYNYSVFVGADDGYIYCLNIMTGIPYWRTPIGGEVRSSPVVFDDVVYATSQSNLYALNASNGDPIWDIQNLNPLNTSPSIENGLIYASSANGYVCAFNASTGTKIWSHPLRTSDSSSPSASGGYVYIGSYDGWVYGLNATTGAEIWGYRTADSVESSPAVAYGYVYVGSEDNDVYCLNATTGSKIWCSATGYWVTSSPAVADGNVYVGSQDGCVYCFNAFTGTEEWSYQTGNAVESSPAIAGNVLYIGSDDGKIYAFALTNQTGQVLQATNSMPATTVVFDAAACLTGASVIFALIWFLYFSRRHDSKAESSEVTGQRLTWFRRHADAVFILAILAFSIIFFVNLGNGVLQVADEQAYSQWAYHMVKTGDYLTPWADGAISFMIGKPPLLEWLMALAYQAFGVTNFAARIWSAGFGALSLVFVYYLGKKLYNRYVGFTSAVVLGTFVTYYTFARYAMTDVPLTCFIVASIYFLLLSQEKDHPYRYAVISGLFFGLALMTKQIAALLIPLIAFIYLVAANKSLRFVVTKSFTLFWSVGLLLFSPWLIYMAARFGNQFWQWYFVYADLTRSSSTIEGHQLASPLFYFNYLASNENWLWLTLLPFAVGLCAYKAFFKQKKQDTLVILWTVIVLLVFSLSQTKIYWYIMPVFPAFALATGNFLYEAAKKVIQRYPRLKPW